MDFLTVAECLFSNTWRLLTGVDIPGLGVSAAAVLVGTFLIFFSIGIIRRLMGGNK